MARAQHASNPSADPSADPAPVDAPVEESAGTSRRSSTDATSDRMAKLEEENARLRAKLEERGEDPGPSVPRRPSFGLSEGERQDLTEHGVTTSPFTGDRLTASGEGVDPANERAERADKRASSAR